MEYTITRKKIKNFIIRIYPDKSIKISVPIKASTKEIEKFILSKKEWMEKTLLKIQKRVEGKEAENNEKEFIKIFGKKYRKKIVLAAENKIKFLENTVIIYILKNDKIFVEKVLREYKTKILAKLLEEYIEKYSKLLNTKVSFYTIKKLKATWGIYHKRKNYISFNLDLVHKEKKSVEYVVLHEMCHIFHLNHQKGFWDLVEKHMPNYKEYMKRLK